VYILDRLQRSYRLVVVQHIYFEYIWLQPSNPHVVMFRTKHACSSSSGTRTLCTLNPQLVESRTQYGNAYTGEDEHGLANGSVSTAILDVGARS
jgi:hypothetical protein